MRAKTGASAALLVAAIVFGSPAVAQTAARLPPSAVKGPIITYPYGAPWLMPQQSQLPRYQSYGYRPETAPTGSQFDPYPPGWDAGGGGP